MASNHLLCLLLSAQDTAPGHRPGQICEPTSSEGSRHPGQCWLDPRDGASLPAEQGKENAGCFSHLEKVERLCKRETRRDLAKPAVFWRYKYLNYTK